VDAALVRTILMKLHVGEYLDESWLIRHAGCTKELLDGMTTADWLTKEYRDPSDFMSDNRYALTEAGQKFAWDKKEDLA